MRTEVKTEGIVMRRTNYGEADRILNIITPQGKIAAIAKGVRKETSKLAGGVEMFMRSQYNIHFGRGDLGIVTSVKMLEYYGEIVKDYGKMELAAKVLGKINQAAEGSDAEEYYLMANECLKALNEGAGEDLVGAWFLMNYLKVMGEEVNLYRDSVGEKLAAEKRYDWNAFEKVFVAREDGEYGAREIKMLRLMTGARLDVVRRVNGADEMVLKIRNLTRTLAQ